MLPLAAYCSISHLFQHGHFLVLGRNFFAARVFLVEIINYVDKSYEFEYACGHMEVLSSLLLIAAIPIYS